MSDFLQPHDSLVALIVEFACNVGDSSSIPGLGRSPGEGNDNHSSILAWEMPWMEEPWRLQSMWLLVLHYMQLNLIPSEQPEDVSRIGTGHF